MASSDHGGLAHSSIALGFPSEEDDFPSSFTTDDHDLIVSSPIGRSGVHPRLNANEWPRFDNEIGRLNARGAIRYRIFHPCRTKIRQRKSRHVSTRWKASYGQNSATSSKSNGPYSNKRKCKFCKHCKRHYHTKKNCEKLHGKPVNEERKGQDISVAAYAKV